MRLLKIVGDSMSPTLEAGDYIICKNIKPQSIRLGLIYVVNHSDLGTIVKRVNAKRKSTFMLSGDNPNSTPSEVMGPVSADRIKERALFSITTTGIKKL